MYCLFCLLRLGSIDPENPFFRGFMPGFVVAHVAADKRAIGLARERTHAVIFLLHARVTPATVRALGATKSTHSARVNTSPRSATWPTRARSRTTSRRTRGSRARRAFPSCSRGTPTAAASPSPCFPRDVRTLQNHFRNSPTSTFRACSYITKVSTLEGKNLAHKGIQPRTNMRGPCCWYMSRAQTRGLGDADV